MSNVAKVLRRCLTCARVRVVGDATPRYVCSITDEAVSDGDTCECWKAKRVSAPKTANKEGK